MKIPKAVADGIKRHVEAGYPNEVCGLLIGRGSTAEAFMEAKNLNVERARDRYELDPLSFKNADEFARSRGLEIIGIYHSHPDHPPLPSETDRTRAWHGWIYLIVSVESGKVSGERAWRLSEAGSQFEEVRLEYT